MPSDRYYDRKRHREWREKVLRRAHYECEECRKYGRRDAKGLPVAATTAHHIKPRELYPEYQYRLDNGEALCAGCHNRKHPEKGGRMW